MVYEWQGHNYKVPAQIVGEKLEQIESKYGQVTHENFLNESRDEESPTHRLFEWDDAIAGEQWRLSQSRNILACIHIVVEHPEKQDEEKVSVRAYVNKEPDNGRKGGYISFHAAMDGRNDYSEVVIQNATRELKEFARRNRKYDKFAGVIREIDAL